MKKLIEYKIETPATLEKVKLLWRKFLKDDPNWHFSLEMSYIELRVSKLDMEFEKYLEKKKWKFTVRFYKNNTPITRKYQSCFDDIYHGYAMLAMTLPKPNPRKQDEQQDIYKVIERILHLACNNFGYKLGNERRILSVIVAGRTYMDGYWKGVKAERNKEVAF